MELNLAEVVAESLPRHFIAIAGRPTADLATENSGYSARCQAAWAQRLFAFFAVPGSVHH